MGQKVDWLVVTAVLGTSLRSLPNPLRRKLDQKGYYQWGHVIIPGFRTVTEECRLNDREQGQLLRALQQFRSEHSKFAGHPLDFLSHYTVRICARFERMRVLDENQYLTLLSKVVEVVAWTPAEMNLLTALQKKTVGALCQARWDLELLPTAVDFGHDKHFLREMEEKFFRWSRRYKVSLHFDMDLPAPLSTAFPRVPDPPAPWVPIDALRQYRALRRR